jgi:hypothetical protein
LPVVRALGDVIGRADVDALVADILRVATGTAPALR